VSTPVSEDRDIVEAIVEWARTDGKTPGRNRVADRFGIGATRATRLLAEADQKVADRSGPRRKAPARRTEPDVKSTAGPEVGPEATAVGPVLDQHDEARPVVVPDPVAVRQSDGVPVRSGPVGGIKPGPVRAPLTRGARARSGLVRLVTGPVRLARRAVRSISDRRSGPVGPNVVAVRSERLPVRTAGADRSGPVRPIISGPDRHRSVATGPARSWTARSASVLITAAPLLGLNAIAMFGQYTAFSDMARISAPGALGIGLVLETIALFLAHHAHQALVAGDSATRLRIASYVFGAAIGALNYHDQAGPNWAPTPLAVIFGLASALSPWLWSIHSRRSNRDRLLAMGLIERRAAKFAGARWLMYPIRTVRMLRWSIWTGEQEPAMAVDWWVRQREERAGHQR
jgi:hypothetical protein